METGKIKYKDIAIEYVVNEEGEVYFIHPQTGELCENVEQVYYGWSFADKEKDEQMRKLIEKIKSNEGDVWEFITQGVDFEYPQ